MQNKGILTFVSCAMFAAGALFVSCDSPCTPAGKVGAQNMHYGKNDRNAKRKARSNGECRRADCGECSSCESECSSCN